MIDFDQAILDLNGAPVKEDGKDITLEKVCTTALLFPAAGDNIDGKEKFERFQLAVKCKGQVKLKAEEISLLKKQIGLICPALVVGRAWGLLDGD